MIYNLDFDMMTYTGQKIIFDKPELTKIKMEDIKQALLSENRYAGHLSTQWSVAHHTKLGLDIINQIYTTDNELKIIFMIHDFSEAYLKDIPTGLKKYLAGYKELEIIWNSHIENSLIFVKDTIQSLKRQGRLEDVRYYVKRIDFLCLLIEMQNFRHPAFPLIFSSLSTQQKEFYFLSQEYLPHNLCNEILKIDKETLWRSIITTGIINE